MDICSVNVNAKQITKGICNYVPLASLCFFSVMPRFPFADTVFVL